MENKTFSLTIKEEIMNRPLKRQEKMNLLSGIFATSKIEQGEFKLIINNKDLYTFVRKILDELNVKYYQPHKNEFCIIKATFLNSKLKMERDYFSGIFLSSGSVSNFKSLSNHLELKYYDFSIASECVKILNKYNLNFKLIKRDKKYITYIKKIENICDFLKAIEAINSYFKLEEYKIERDYLNNINRITNFDVYNQQRIANANVVFLKNLEFIEQNNLISYFGIDEMKFFNIKKKNLDLSLTDLASILEEHNIVKSRSSLNHSLIKLKKIVAKYNRKNF
ncbi:DNA-binding protein WhiA [Mycoplasma enhydrae]|uniref:DNA-binding protein WhiA n=1 Tax=Mycoplasma enhydrae TaxID=2499220 RepID=UPI00197CA48C|nr:DNA-binding protein WhiA [Mycoplasma enhydrae]MBN4089305.1 DNA-binding protein WhiA [Mycoplasma enhydrae]MCV3733906.1 DNA-binding protein WhiA [Mycoplasma enhydrae]MCV3753489.1 DNA-binding protein WhiA [Mycoplasma enhydrae]